MKSKLLWGLPWLTMHQKGCRRNLIPTVFIGQRGGLFNRGEMFGCGWRVNMAYLYTRGRGGLDIALSWKREKRFMVSSLTAVSFMQTMQAPCQVSVESQIDIHDSYLWTKQRPPPSQSWPGPGCSCCPPRWVTWQILNKRSCQSDLAGWIWCPWPHSGYPGHLLSTAQSWWHPNPALHRSPPCHQKP